MLRTPYPPSRLKLGHNKDESNFYKDYMTNINGIIYHDLNEYKSSIYNYTNEDFSDYHHANYKGAIKMSKQLVDIINTNQKQLN